MPEYDYRCKKCDKRFSLFLPMGRRNEAVGKTCEEKGCNGKNTRVFKSPRFVFVGDGFDSTNLSQDAIDTNPDFWDAKDPSNPKIKVMK